MTPEKYARRFPVSVCSAVKRGVCCEASVRVSRRRGMRQHTRLQTEQQGLPNKDARAEGGTRSRTMGPLSTIWPDPLGHMRRLSSPRFLSFLLLLVVFIKSVISHCNAIITGPMRIVLPYDAVALLP